jgi:hypothetical protein
MLPPGFEERNDADLSVWALGGLVDAAIAVTAPEGCAGESARGRVRFCELPAANGAPASRVAVRHYFRGGILAPLLRDFHLDRRRPLREIELYVAARAAGVPTLEPVAGVSRRATGPLWRCDLVTRAVRGGRDLGELFTELGRGPAKRRARVLAAVAKSVRALHDAGFEHRDLNLKNILIGEDEEAPSPSTSTASPPKPFALSERSESKGPAEGLRALIIDLDGATRHAGPVPLAARRANLLRLYRSSQKFAQRLGAKAAPTKADLVRFAVIYAGGDRDALRELAVPRLPRHRLRSLLWTRGETGG